MNPELTTVGKAEARSILVMTSAVSGSGLAGLAVAFLTGLIVPNLLGPDRYGAWQSIYIWTPYLGLSATSILEGMHRKLPLLRGAGEFELAFRLKQSVFRAVVLLGLIQSMILSVVAFVGPWTVGVRLGMLALSLSGAFLVPTSAYTYMFRGDNVFPLLARYNFASALVTLLYPPLVWRWGVTGAYVALIAGNVSLFSYCWYLHKAHAALGPSYSGSPAVAWSDVRQLLTFGVPVACLGLVTIIGRAVDRYLILTFLDRASLGYYLANVMFAAPFAAFIGSMNGVLYVRQSERYGASRNAAVLRPIVSLMIASTGRVCFPVAAAIIVGLPEIVSLTLPKYTAGVVAGQIYLAGLVFYLVAGAGYNVVLVVGRPALLWAPQCTLLLVNAAVSAILLALGYKLVGAASGALIAFVLSGCWLLARTTRCADMPSAERRRAFIQVGFCALWCYGSAFMFGRGCLVANNLLGSLFLKELLCLASTAWLAYRPIREFRAVIAGGTSG